MPDFDGALPSGFTLDLWKAHVALHKSIYTHVPADSHPDIRFGTMGAYCGTCTFIRAHGDPTVEPAPKIDLSTPAPEVTPEMRDKFEQRYVTMLQFDKMDNLQLRSLMEILKQLGDRTGVNYLVTNAELKTIGLEEMRTLLNDAVIALQPKVAVDRVPYTSLEIESQGGALTQVKIDGKEFKGWSKLTLELQEGRPMRVSGTRSISGPAHQDTGQEWSGVSVAQRPHDGACDGEYPFTECPTHGRCGYCPRCKERVVERL